MTKQLITTPADEILITCFGEVLWDCFGQDKRLGGAPLNVCWRLKSLGLNSQLISSVGNDPLGGSILSLLKQHKLNTGLIQVNDDKATSEVLVELNSRGSATYTIVEDSAWDNIQLTNEALNAVKESDLFIFGSLVGRSAVSFDTLSALLPHAKFKVFDVNLREPHYKISQVVEWMQHADFIKLNDDELFLIAEEMGCVYNSLEQCLEFIAEQTNTQNLCVTKGSHGAILKIDGCNYYNSGFKAKVVDTVGAGDGFLGALLYQLCVQDNPQYAVDFACAVGALIAQNSGATPNLTTEQILSFINPKA
ncbi:carbohydrate kinase [Catenovulum agarivorans DS-2]|uniref:Carbohydrate kinase n=1 Tax=Catenovulum agarivorans DS-2 TaxID=1328313 RepID=W7QKN3_9ALTE|nr:carbohydrate kinase [Catenovulum agarivorans]EWH08623.1 carbohydrate kinase [Catenovulum agarivorans DS-2]